MEIVAGGANNQLAEERHGIELERRGMLYAPDFVINAGGLINVYGELEGWPEERAKRKAQEIYDAILKVFAIAKRDGIPSFQAADRLAEEDRLCLRVAKDVQSVNGQRSTVNAAPPDRSASRGFSVDR